ncbi:MAG TPA: hypothetical protein VGM37_07745 [Armatimonadota bacterium]|jgi:hypothetical protein
MTPGVSALGIACLVAWGGLWGYLRMLQARLDAIEEAGPEPPANEP